MENERIGARIEQRRKELGLTLDDIAREIGVAKSTVQRYEKGTIEKIKLPVMEAIARALNVNPAWLCFKSDVMEQTIPIRPTPSNIIPMPQTYKVPLVGTIACGQLILAVEDADEIVEVPEHIKADFALRCKGDSMIDAHIYDGDIVYIHSQPKVESGQIAAVRIGDEATLKKVRIYPDMIILEPANQAFDPLIYRGEELNDIEILGKAVAFTSVIK
ncbi:MAG: helix-turn-helix domain-containing protein [Clostridiales bacterium]|nr:helix-turn-helix domain-containing protein [Clostridiales bacterium]